MIVSTYIGMGRRMIALPLCLWFSGAGLALSEKIEIVPADPWEIIHLAREVGPAEVGKDGMKDPLISGKIGDLNYEISFYGCYLGRACSSILFQARLEREDWKPELSDIHTWNSAKLIGRAWIDGDSRAVLDHPVAMSAGLPAKSLEGTFAAWQLALEEFADYLDF